MLEHAVPMDASAPQHRRVGQVIGYIQEECATLGANNKRSRECPSRRRVAGENGGAIVAIWLYVIVDDMDVRNRSYRRTNCL